MHLAKFVAATVALSIGLGNVAFAQGGGRGESQRHEAHERQEQRHAERRHDRRDDHRADRRHDHRHDHRAGHRHGWHHERLHQRAVVRHADHWDMRDPRWQHPVGRGAGPRQDLYRGGRLPSHYRNHVHVVDNWQASRLHRPPVGHHWVQVGGDHVLAAIATGVILSVLLGH